MITATLKVRKLTKNGAMLTPIDTTGAPIALKDAPLGDVYLKGSFAEGETYTVTLTKAA